MTVYVDDMRLLARVGRIEARWSHLMADTDEELHAFAASIGLRRSWAQYPGTWKSHYDVTDSKRAQAIYAGAVPIGYGSPEAIALTRRKRQQRPPTPQLRLPLNDANMDNDYSYDEASECTCLKRGTVVGHSADCPKANRSSGTRSGEGNRKDWTDAK